MEATCPPHEVDATADRLAQQMDCRLDTAGGRLLLTCYVHELRAEDAAAACSTHWRSTPRT